MKIYPSGLREITVSDRAIFREPGWEESGDKISCDPEWLTRYFEPTPEVELSAYQLERREAAELQRRCESIETPSAGRELTFLTLRFQTIFRTSLPSLWMVRS